MEPGLLGALLVAAGVIALAVVVRALFLRRFPAPKRLPRNVITHEEERLSEARKVTLDEAKDAAWEQMNRLPPGALGG